MPEGHAPLGRASQADWFVLVLLAISLLGNVVLGVAVLRLTDAASGASARAATSQPPVGSTVPPLDVQRLTGERESISFFTDSRPTVVYIFKPSCAWCARNLENVRAVIATATSSHRVIAVSLDPDVAEYAERIRLGIPVYVRPSPSIFEPYHLGPTPQTLVVSREGKVLKSWVGAYAGRTREEVETYFKIRLPGIGKPVTDSSKP